MDEEILRSFGTLCEMVTDRAAFDARFAAVDPARLSELRGELQQGALSGRQVFALDLSPEVRVVYDVLPKYRLPDVRKFMSDRALTYILVLRDKLSGANLKSLAACGLKHLEVFRVRELWFNITKHELVPKHTVLAPEEVDALVERYQVRSKSCFQQILRTDPVARYFGLRPGMVVRIDRVSLSAGEHSPYRVCV